MKTFARIVLLLLLNLWLTGLVGTFAADWNDFLGPERNGKSQEKIDIVAWGKTGPPVVWHKQIGTSYGGTHCCQWTTLYLRTPQESGASHLLG